MVSGGKKYTPLEGYANNRTSNNMSFAKKAATMNDQRENGNAFRTDSAISGNRYQERERPLQRWIPDENIPDGSLEGQSMNSNGGGGWNQFAANEALFGLTTDYDENIYTTTIDKSNPNYRARKAEADRIAKQIESSTTTNRHVAEERIRDNLTQDTSGLDEEDKYSGVQRQGQDFPPLSATSGKYQPPGRRAPAAKPAAPTGPITDPAIISSRIAQPATQKQAAAATPKTTEQPQIKATVTKAEVSTPPTTTESSFVATPEAKATPANTSTAASRTESPAKPAATTAATTATTTGVSATATVERDVVTAFRGFAQQQRSQAEKVRLSKAKADKNSKLAELRAFASSFKLNSAIPNDLVAIIAKDPAKQRLIQENAKRQAEEIKQEQAKKSESQAASPAAPATPADPKTAQRTMAQAAAVPSSAPRHTPGRAPNVPQGPYNNNNNGQQFRQDRNNMRGQGSPYTGPQQQMGQRGHVNQNRNGAYPGAPYDNRQPPTGPADTASRRTSAASSQKMNPASLDFRPNPNAITFNPNGSGKPSTASTPRSESVVEGPPKCESASGLLIKRRPGEPKKKGSTKKAINIMERVISEQPPAGKTWERFGGIKPAFDTLPVWRQPRDDEPEDSTMRLTYAEVFKRQSAIPPMMSPRQNHNPVPHQHQLPFHLQQGAGGPRPSPRQPGMHMHNNSHMGQQFNANHDDQRMMPSLSAQSNFASPRLQPIPMAYQSPMGQPAQMFPQGAQPVMHYMGPGAPQMAQQFRSYSGAGQPFVPQQPTQMGGPVMIPGPQGAPYFGSPNLMAPGPQMMYSAGQPMPFQQGGPVPMQGGPVPGAMQGQNGFPSPRPVGPGGPQGGAPMMMSGSQQGSQQGFNPMSPGMGFGQPIYAQGMPGQMQQQMRGFPQGPQQFQQSPMPHYNQPHQNHNGGPRHNSNGYNNHRHNNHNGPNQHHNGHNGQNGGPPSAVPNNVNVPTGPQRPAPEVGGDEAK